MKARKLIEGARSIIRDKSKWTRAAYARNDCGFVADILAEDAVTFCALGALYKTAQVDPGIRNEMYSEVYSAGDCLQTMARKMGYIGVGKLNDSGGHPKVMELFDRALTELKNESTEAD